MPSPTHEVHSSDTSGSNVAGVDMKLEVVIIPVSDVDRAREFYKKLGWRLDVTPPSAVQLTPRGSWCSVQFGKTLTSAAPGSAKSYLIVSDIVAAREQLVAAGIEVSEFFHIGPEGRVSGLDPERGTLARLVQRSRRQRLASAGDHDPASRARRLWCDFLQLCKRTGERASACRDRPRTAREAHRSGRPELARLVRQVHGGRTVRRRAAPMISTARETDSI